MNTNPQRKQAFLNALRHLPSASTSFGIPWEATETEQIPSCKILLIGDKAMEAFSCFKIHSLNNEPVLKHSIIPDGYHVRFAMGDHDVDVLFCILRRDILDIEYRQKMFEHLDVLVLVYSTSSSASFSDVLVKSYPQASQLSPETPLLIMGVQSKFSEAKDVQFQQVQDLASLTGALSICEVNLEDFASVDQNFDSIIRNAIVERINKGILPADRKRRARIGTNLRRKKVASNQRNILRESNEPPPLTADFLIHGTVEALEEMVSNKTHNYKLVDGTSESPLMFTLKKGNTLLAKKLLDLDNGVINLADRSLEQVPGELLPWAEQGFIKDLNLSQNMLQALPIPLRHIKKVDTTQNPLQSIPIDIRHGKWSKIRKYLDQIATRAAQWNIRKLLLIGEEAVGKSTLVRCLENKTGKTDIGINLATDGIEIKSIEIRGDAKDAVVFSTWDMGGQITFYPTHQFFMSNAGIYILTFNMEHTRYPRIEYWMKQIKLLGTECSALLIMVGTHCENCTEEQIEAKKQTLLTRYPRYAYRAFQSKVFAVSGKTGQGIRELKKALIQLAHSTQTSTVVPAAWVQLHELLKVHREAGTNYINWSIYSSWAGQCGLHSENILMATEHLHNSGSLIYYPHEELKNLVILNPQWLADVMSCLITIKNNFVVNGYIDAKYFPEIFRNYSSIVDTIVNLLEKFKIIHPMNAEKTRYLVPSLLPNSRPSADIAAVYPVALPTGMTTLGRVFRFSQLPLGLFGRLIVSLLQRKGVTGQVFWRSGIVTTMNLTEESPLQTITEYEQDRYQLSIYIRYAPNHHQEALKEWRALLELIKTLMDSFYPQLMANMKELVPCIHCLRKQRYRERVYLFPYSDIDNAQGEGFLYCQKIPSPSRCVFISQLAPDIYLADLPRLESDSLTVGELLGEGAFGKVYKATLNGDPVALKELKVQEGDPDAKKHFQEFQTEAYMMSLLDHPNIVRLYGVMLNPPRMILQFVDGKDLFQFLHPIDPITNDVGSLAQESFPWSQRLTIAFHIAQGLHYLQSITPPVVHRDFRSPNIFITKDNHALIGDFGLARVVTGTIGGALRTWQWLAPEIFDSTADNYDQRTDIYSFGIILWELAAIEIPFDAERKTPGGSKVQDMDIKKAIVRDHLRPSIPLSTPEEFSALIHRCWSGDPSQRPSTNNILLRLTQILQDHDVPVPSVDIDVEEDKKIHVSFPTIQAETEPESLSISLTEDSASPLTDITLTDDSTTNDRYCTMLIIGNRVWVGKRSGEINYFFLMLMEHKRKIIQFIVVNETVLSSSEDGTVIVWNKKSLKKLYQFEPFKSETVTIHMKLVSCKNGLGPLSQFIWIVSPFEGKITIWNMNFTLVHSITQEELIGTCVIEQHGEMVLTGADTSRRIHIYNAKVFDFIGSFTAHSSPVTKIFSHCDKIWTLSLVDIRVWRARSLCELECIHTFHTLSSRPRTIAATTNGRILTGSMDGCVLLWDAQEYSVLQEMVVYCNKEASYGILHLQEDSRKRLWCITSNRIAVWPDSENLHVGYSGNTPNYAAINLRSQSMDTKAVRKSLIIRGRGNRGRAGNRAATRGFPPPRPTRIPGARLTPTRPHRQLRGQSPLISSSADNLPATRNLRQSNDSSPLSTNLGGRIRPVPPPRTKPASDGNIDVSKLPGPSISPLSPRFRVPNKKIPHEELAVPIISCEKLAEAPLVSPPDAPVTTENMSDSTASPLPLSARGISEKKRRKKRIIASFEGMEQKVTSSVSLAKLVGIVPGLELDMIDGEHPVQIICSRVNGKLQIELTCPNGLPDMKLSE